MDKYYKKGREAAAEAIVNSIARHKITYLAAETDDIGDLLKLSKLNKKFSDEKVESLETMVDMSKNTDKISVDIKDSIGNTKNILGEFDDDGNMSLHVIRGHSKILDQDIDGKGHVVEKGENSKFYKKVTGKSLSDESDKLVKKERKRVGLKENSIEITLNKDVEEAYEKYVKDHIDYVKSAYDYIKMNHMNLLKPLEISVDDMDVRIKNHDRSKWSDEEFIPYADQWYGNNLSRREDETEEYKNAWKHHYTNNPHHEEYWGKEKDMPYSYILELICDWLSFSIKKNNIKEIKSFWESKKEEKSKFMSDNTIDTISNIIDKISNDDDLSNLLEDAILESRDKLLEKRKRMLMKSIRFIPEDVLDKSLPDLKEKPFNLKVKTIQNRINNLPENEFKKLINSDSMKKIENEVKSARSKLTKGSLAAGGSTTGLGVSLGAGFLTKAALATGLDGLGYAVLAILSGYAALGAAALTAIGVTTGSIINSVRDKKYLKKNTPEIINILKNENILTEEVSFTILSEMSEFETDLKNMYHLSPDKVNIEDINDVDIMDVINTIKDIRYGFISKKDGTLILNRDWIHKCQNLRDYYNVQENPEITIRDKVGICTDQCLAIRHLFTKLHPDYKTQMYALMKGRFGHCVIGFMKPNNEWYYLENAWNKERGLHGPFESQNALENYFKDTYYKHHKDDNDDDVIVMTYEDYTRASLNESFIILPNIYYSIEI